jgi:hypothetical protein
VGSWHEMRGFCSKPFLQQLSSYVAVFAMLFDCQPVSLNKVLLQSCTSITSLDTLGFEIFKKLTYKFVIQKKGNV